MDTTEIAVRPVVDKMAPCQLNIRTIPWYLRQRFKVVCADHGITMEAAVIEMIKAVSYHPEQNPKIIENLTEAARCS